MISPAARRRRRRHFTATINPVFFDFLPHRNVWRSRPTFASRHSRKSGSRQRFARFANPVAYLRRVARNLGTDHLRKRLSLRSRDEVPVETVTLTAPDQIAALEARDMLRRLEVALARLKPRTREILLAHRLDGYSYREIATRTGLGVKAVEKHMSRVIAHLDRLDTTDEGRVRRFPGRIRSPRGVRLVRTHARRPYAGGPCNLCRLAPEASRQLGGVPAAGTPLGSIERIDG